MPQFDRNKALQQFAAFRTHPGMYLSDSYDTATAFILGMDHSYAGALLKGLEDWARAKYPERAPLSWSQSLKYVYEDMPVADKQKHGNSSTAFMFSMLEQFFKETGGK